MPQPIRIAIAGVGNCASSLVQGIAWYAVRRRAGDGDEALGLADGSKTETPPSEESLNELREMALGIAPTNTIEAMLALQITQLHRLAIAQAFTLTLSQTVESAAQSAKILDTLIRAFASHAETLRKLRS